MSYLQLKKNYIKAWNNMEIKTKYNINDEVYFIHGNKIRHNKIIRIDITIYEEDDKVIPRIKYTIDLGIKTGRVCDTITSREEKEVFSTKEELFKTLE